MDRDPVCGERLRPGEEAASATYAGQTDHLCSVECRTTFERDPKTSLAPGTEPAGQR